jgi:hypothetical protein
MFPINRRHTEALEKSAKAEQRLAAAEESMARDLKAFLSDDDEGAQPTPPPVPKGKEPATKQSTSRKA